MFLSLHTAALLSTVAAIQCYHCYKASCRNNYELDDDVKLASIRTCAAGTDRCFTYYLRDITAGQLLTTERKKTSVDHCSVF